MGINTVRGRALLAVDSDAIHWSRHAARQSIGFRKWTADSGTWWARFREPGGKLHYKQLGEFSEHTPAKQYDAALGSALEWFRSIDAGVIPHSLTVKDICERHIAAKRVACGDDQLIGDEKVARDQARLRRLVDDEHARLNRLVYSDRIARIEFGKLRKVDVEGWRARMAATPAKVSRSRAKNETRPRAPASINRDLSPLRTAFNRAHADGLAASDLAWRTALRPTKNADRRRDVDLDRADRIRLIDHADPEAQPFLRGLSMLPLRPGALAQLTVADLNVRLRSLRIGRDKTGGERRITLPPATAEFFVHQAKGKLPAAPLIARGDGSAWNKDAWKWPIKDAALAAGLSPKVTAYALRHSTISDLVVGGLDLLTIAAISGTSVAMIERHYGHLRQQHAADALATLAL